VKNAYKCIYIEINRKPGSADNGLLVEHAQKFNTFIEAVNFGRALMRTNTNMVGKPIIDITEND
jgi:hypothetical protein